MAGIESRLRALEERYDELSAQLSAPDVYQDLDRVQRLSQEQAKLREVVEVGRNWRAAQTAAREAQEMSRDSDEEMRALAEEEESTQRAAEEAAMERLRVLLLQPILATQLLTTREPDDAQMEVAIAALNAARAGELDDTPLPLAS